MFYLFIEYKLNSIIYFRSVMLSGDAMEESPYIFALSNDCDPFIFNGFSTSLFCDNVLFVY